LLLPLDGFQYAAATLLIAATQKLASTVRSLHPEKRPPRSGKIQPPKLQFILDEAGTRFASVTVSKNALRSDTDVAIRDAVALLGSVIRPQPEDAQHLAPDATRLDKDPTSQTPTQAAALLKAWADSGIEKGTPLTDPILSEMALIAIDELTRPSIIDPTTGLILPPAARKPYRERGHHPDGRRLTIFEHLRREYGEYIDAGLLFSGHLLEIDKPAYEALLYQAEKEAKEKGEKRGSNTAEFCLRHGVLTGDHLTSPPPGRDHQIELIKLLHAKRIGLGHQQLLTT